MPNWLAVAAPILGDPSLKALRCCSPPLLILGDPSPSPPQPLIQATFSSNRTSPAASLQCSLQVKSTRLCHNAPNLSVQKR